MESITEAEEIPEAPRSRRSPPADEGGESWKDVWLTQTSEQDTIWRSRVVVVFHLTILTISHPTLWIKNNGACLTCCSYLRLILVLVDRSIGGQIWLGVRELRQIWKTLEFDVSYNVSLLKFEPKHAVFFQNYFFANILIHLTQKKLVTKLSVNQISVCLVLRFSKPNVLLHKEKPIYTVYCAVWLCVWHGLKTCFCTVYQDFVETLET